MYRPTLRAPPSHSLSRVTVRIRVRVRVSIRTRTQKQRDGTVRSRQREKKMVVGVVGVVGVRGGIFCTHLLLLSMVYILLCVFLPVRHKTYSLACTRSLACQHSREAVGYSRRRRRRRERKRKGSRLLATWKACFSKTTKSRIFSSTSSGFYTMGKIRFQKPSNACAGFTKRFLRYECTCSQTRVGDGRRR